MPDLSTIPFDVLYCLFKGEPGTRKSTCALSFPQPQYWFSWDIKMEGLLLPMRQWNINPKKVSYDDYTNWDKGKSKLEVIQTRGIEAKTLIIDSITSLGDAINRQTLKIKGGGGEGKKIAGIPVNSIEDFNAEDSALKEMVALTKDIHEHWKVNVILIAHVIQVDTRTPDGKTHVSRTLVTAGKKIAAKIPAYCGEVYHFNVDAKMGGGAQYGLLTTHVGDDFARTALPLPAEVKFGNEPLYDKFLLPAMNVIRKDRAALAELVDITSAKPIPTITK